MKKVSVIGLIVILIALEQVTKWWTVKNIDLGELRPFLPGLVSLTYLRNYGAAFSMLQNQQLLFTLVTILVISGATYYLFRTLGKNWLQSLALVLIIAGGLGNFIDRLRQGFVIDMIHLDVIDFAIFNVADIYLTLGVILLMLVFWREEDEIRN
ncbi:signal peptidase II [Streptococcus cuniculipharyngis]|uniref:Lipoprotein signal peptidase n=1 Tax=Streptococcus cuniculipharyngis TaxID=1562651 RepID=A0A5C5SFS4_9STRE|nr:signal peptidase II [Streptococcus cuniculipharyngis]TWS99130.1 signal peptidase II [Streptococcus cuniculipharyngis]